MPSACRLLRHYVDNNETPTIEHNTLFCNDISASPRVGSAHCGHEPCYVRQSYHRPCTAACLSARITVSERGAQGLPRCSHLALLHDLLDGLQVYLLDLLIRHLCIPLA